MPNLSVQDYLISRGLHTFGGYANHPVISRAEVQMAGCPTDPAALAACPLVETIHAAGKVYYTLKPAAYDERDYVDLTEANREYTQDVTALAQGVASYILRVVQSGPGLDKLRLATEGAPKALVGALLRCGPYLPWCTRASPGILPSADVRAVLQKGSSAERELEVRRARLRRRVDPRHWQELPNGAWPRAAMERYRFNFLVAQGEHRVLTTWGEQGEPVPFAVPKALVEASGEGSTFDDAARVIAAFWRVSTDAVRVSPDRLPPPEEIGKPPEDLRQAMRLRKFDLLFTTTYAGQIFRFVSEDAKGTRARLPVLGEITRRTPLWVVWQAINAQYVVAWNAGQCGIIHPDSLTDIDRAQILAWVAEGKQPTQGGYNLIDVLVSSAKDGVALADVVHVLGLALPPPHVEDPAPVVSLTAVQQHVEEAEPLGPSAVPEVDEAASETVILESHDAPSIGGMIEVLPEETFPFRGLSTRAWRTDPAVESALPMIMHVLRLRELHTFCITLGHVPNALARLVQARGNPAGSMELLRAADAHVLFQADTGDADRGDYDVFIGFHAAVGPVGATLHVGSMFRYHRGPDEYTEHPIVWITDRSGAPGGYAYHEAGLPYYPVEDRPFNNVADPGWWARAIFAVLRKHEGAPGSFLQLKEPAAQPRSSDGLGRLLYWSALLGAAGPRPTSEAARAVTPSYVCIRYQLQGYQDLYVTSALDGGVIVAHVGSDGLVDLALYAANWTSAARRLFVSVGRTPQVVPTPDGVLLQTFSSNLIHQGWVHLAETSTAARVEKGRADVLSLGVHADAADYAAEREALERSASARSDRTKLDDRRAPSDSEDQEAWILRASERLRSALDGQYAEGFPTVVRR